MTGNTNGPQRLALIVATSAYQDEGLSQLVSPAQDAEALAGVLAEPTIGDFSVSSVVDATSGEICRAVEDFAAERERGDLLLLYLSCHGLKDEQGRLYFAARDTRRDRLRSTAVSAGFVNDILFASRSRRKVLLLDCCYSGAFAKGLAVKADPSVHTSDHFDARGLVVLTASDATQYAFEGDALSGRAAPSIFTASIARGLQSGAADVDGDGLVSVDDVYEFARRQLAAQSRPQSPRKWEFDVAGRIVLARSPATEMTAVADPAGSPRESLPVILPARGMPAEPSASRAPARIRQGQWWLGAGLFLATSVALSLLLARWTLSLLNWLLASTDSVHTSHVTLFTSLGAAAWALAYAATDVTRPARSRWYDLHWRWLITLRQAVRPAGWRQFLGAASASVPINVTLTLAASLGAAVLGYNHAGGSQGRDMIFPIAYTLVTALALATYLASNRTPAGAAHSAARADQAR